MQKELLHLIEQSYNNKQSSNKVEVLKHLVMALIHLIAEKHQEMPVAKSQTKNRTHELIDSFYSLVSSHAHKQRNVQFYADQLHVSTQYLSSFLKQNTGKSTVVEGFKVVFYSLAGLEVVLPFFIFGGYWCKKKIK
ncbi:hypothetical protein ACPDHL_03180 [Myroides sp. C15-4]|uniref:hypothetical protein n=1 Tax=Myroides sp. C15-4 TaxID=3400532 RepID=UPI003D2F6BD7